MNGIIICGHGMFASGINSALELIMGPQQDLITVDFKKGETNTELKKNLRNAISLLDKTDNILILCDLLSGSPFNNAILEAMNDKRLRVIYGLNLGMLMEITMKRNFGCSIEELQEIAVKSGREQVGYFIEQPFDDELDDFDE